MSNSKSWPIKDGGYAFPLPSTEANYTEFGMTLRDWFAGQVLTSFPHGASARERAAFAYAVADEMIAQRERIPTRAA